MSATIAPNAHITTLIDAVAPGISRRARHPVWSALRDRDSLVRFMESHVYCVWDFMSLLLAAPCADDDERWAQAHAAAVEPLDARERLWDALARSR